MRIGILTYLFQLIFVYFLWLTLIWFYKKHEKHLHDATLQKCLPTSVCLKHRHSNIFMTDDSNDLLVLNLPYTR